MSAVLTSLRIRPTAAIPSLLVLSIVGPIASLGDYGQIASEIVYLNGALPPINQNIEECERCWRKALKLRTWRAAPDQRYSTMANRLAIFLEDQKRDAEAEYFYKEALQVSDKTIGRDHAATSVILVNLGQFYCRTGRLLEAEQLLNQAMYIQLREFGNTHIRTSQLMKVMGELHQARGEYSKAKAFYVQALDIRKKYLEADHTNIYISSIELAQMYLQEERPREAEPLIKNALRISEKVNGHDHPKTAHALYCLGLTYDLFGKRAEAEKLHQEAFRILKNSQEENTEYGVVLQERLAGSLRRSDP